LNAEDVVVNSEHVEVGRDGARLGLDGNLRVIDAGEVAGTGRLVLFGLERERVRVHTGQRRASVVVVGLDLVEVLTGLLLEAVLAVKHKLERVDGAGKFFGPGNTFGSRLQKGGTGHRRGDEAVTGTGTRAHVRREGRDRRAGEVPQVGTGHRTLVSAPHKLLNGVVVGEADLLDLASAGKSVGTGMLNLLDQVFVTLLGEAATLFGVQVDVVGVHLEGGTIGVLVELGGQVEIQTDFVVLERDQGERQTGVAVEEEDQREEDLTGIGTGGGHLTPRRLLGLIEVQLGVQTPPPLVVLVDALTTDGQFNILDGTLRGEARVIGGTGDFHETSLGLHLDVHVGDEVTVTGDGHGDTAVVSGVTVDGLFDVFHREVGVALVNSLEESYSGVAGQVYILGTVSYELHETTGHFFCCTIHQHFISARKNMHPFSCVYIKCQPPPRRKKSLNMSPSLSPGPSPGSRKLLVLKMRLTSRNMKVKMKVKSTP